MKRSLSGAAWSLLGYTIVVILWGAFVRASGAGAGCGNHWPLCNGEVLPHSPSLDTLIELTHRLSSGLLGLLVLAFILAAFKTYPRNHAVRKGAVWTLWFVVAEALVGAGLVKFEWVAANDSLARVYVMAFHLVNTLFLVAALTLTAWFAGAHRRLAFRGRARLAGWLAAGAAGLLLVGSSGAVTALGDTLVLSQGIRPEDSPVVARLVASRFYHPALALAALLPVAFVALGRAGRVSSLGAAYARWVLVVFAAQLGLGAANVWLRAPIWMQLVHLAVSNALWVLFVLLAATLLSSSEPAP